MTDLAKMTFLESGGHPYMDIFKNNGKWIYFDSNKERTNDMTKAKYQQWKNDSNK